MTTRDTCLNVGLLAATLWVTSGCTDDTFTHDASGVFEARETVIAAEVAGRILEMPIEEGQALEAGGIAAKIDCKQLELRRSQALASDNAISERTTEARPQIEILREQQKAATSQLAVQQEQLTVLEREQRRFAALVEAKAAPAKQLDDINGKIAILRRQMAATKRQVAIVKQQRSSTEDQVSLQNRAIRSEREPTRVGISLIEDQIQKCNVVNPLTGTVLTKYAERYEFATPGKPLYRIADLSEMTLRAYITGDQLGAIKLGQAAKVFVDVDADTFREHAGTLIWVSDKAEFTPKTIQTKDERSNLVYAVKVRVPNDGTLKIGMYGEVSF